MVEIDNIIILELWSLVWKTLKLQTTCTMYYDHANPCRCTLACGELDKCIFRESYRCLHIRGLSIYYVTPCILKIIVVDIEMTIILDFWSLVC